MKSVFLGAVAAAAIAMAASAAIRAPSASSVQSMFTLSESARIELIMKKYAPTGNHGFYLKEVGGSALLAKNPDYVFYPASTYKVLIHGAIMRMIQDGKLTLGDLVQSAGKTKTVAQAIDGMMNPSNNDDANALLLAAGGIDAVNAVGAKLGVSPSTKFRHDYNTYGCALTPRAEKANTLTLADAGRFYESVYQGQLVTGASYGEFFDRMIDEPELTPARIGWVAAQEANKLGVPQASLSAFLAQVKAAEKGGWTYGADNSTYCLSEAGIVTIPARRGSTTPGAAASGRVFVYGVFGDFVSVKEVEASRPAFMAMGSHVVDALPSEMLRPYIAAALLSYK